MAWRFRTHLRFQPGSGMAEWAQGQLDNRLVQAHHLNPGTPAEEQSHVTRNGDNLHSDLFFPDDRQDLAEDTRTTLTDPTVLAAVAEDDEHDTSWMDYHHCLHDLDPPQPCIDIPWRWDKTSHDGPIQWEPGIALTTDDQVVYDGIVYDVIQGHTTQEGWEPPNTPALFEPV